MSITVRPDLESRLRAQAEGKGLTVEVYLERLVRADQDAKSDLESLALEGLNSGDPIDPTPDYWAEKHRRLDEIPATKLEDVAGRLRYTGRPRSIAEMDRAIAKDVKRHHRRGRSVSHFGSRFSLDGAS